MNNSVFKQSLCTVLTKVFFFFFFFLLLYQNSISVALLITSQTLTNNCHNKLPKLASCAFHCEGSVTWQYMKTGWYKTFVLFLTDKNSLADSFTHETCSNLIQSPCLRYSRGCSSSANSEEYLT